MPDFVTPDRGTRTGLRGASVRSSYLGFALAIGERHVTVTPPAGGPVVCRSVQEARRFVRGYRRADRKETR